MIAFDELSPEARLQKIVAHVATGHPVPEGWVAWLVQQGFGDGIQSDYVGGKARVAFADLPPEERKARILSEIAQGNPLPGGWVEWLLEQPPEGIARVSGGP